MSWLYCEPKSSTRTVWRPCPFFASGRGCVAVAVLLRSGLPHTDVLGLLQGLALRRDIHFNFSQPEGADAKAFMARELDANAAIYEVVLRLGGSVSAEHGIGQLKRGLLRQVKDPVALEIMRAIKLALDPNGILNPGKVL